MNVTKDQFTAEILRRKHEREEARAAELSAKDDFDEYSEHKIRVEIYAYRNNRSYRGKCHTNRSYES